jgi:N-acetylglucosamine-6-phosphate deacetylase
MTSPDYVLRNARVVLAERVLEQATVLIEDGRITSISGADDTVPDKHEQLDLQGLTLYPGFIDVHIHGAVGVDALEARANDLQRVSQFLLTQGVTAWLPTLVPAPSSDYARAIESIQQAMQSSTGARILGVHYEGPFVNSAQCGALRKQFFRTYSGPADIDDLPKISGDAARHMMTLAPEVKGGIELTRELNRRGWIVSIGHTRAPFELLNEAFDAGASHMTHFMNAMAPLHHRSPGPVAWGLTRDDVSCDIIADGVHIDPNALRLLLKVKGAERMMLISDAIAAAGLGDGDYKIWGETITVKGGRTSNSQGNIAGSVISILDAVRMMRSLGASEIEIAQMSSTNPARLLGIDDECGTIAEGKRADLVALDPDGNVRLTVVGGRVATVDEPQIDTDKRGSEPPKGW